MFLYNSAMRNNFVTALIYSKNSFDVEIEEKFQYFHRALNSIIFICFCTILISVTYIHLESRYKDLLRKLKIDLSVNI